MVLVSLRLNRIFRLGALLALWAMLLPALLPLVHHPAVLMGEAQPICHITLGGGGHQQAPDHGKAQSACPICQGLSSLAQGFVAPDSGAVALMQPVPVAVPIPAQMFIVFAPDIAAWPRAPPVLA